MASFQSQTFEHAPLIEVALSVQLRPLLGFTSAHAGEFWQSIRDEFPICQEQPPLPPIGEFFGQSRSLQGIQTIQTIQIGFQGIRNWFLSPDGVYLLQIQKDRFALNWRKIGPEAQYPRYPTIRKKFVEIFEKFSKYTVEAKLGSCEVNLSEVSYINQWIFDSGEKFGDGVGSWLRFAPANVATLEMESATINAQFLVRGKSDDPIGRLYVNVAPIVAASGSHGINLELICRIIPLDLPTNMPFRPLDLARESIVTTFTEITSDSAQRVWRGE